MKTRTGLLVILCVISFGSGPATADHNMNRPVFGLMDFFPFAWTQDGKRYGIFYELAQEISDQTAMNADIHVMSLPRSIQNIGMGISDILIAYKDPHTIPGVTFTLEVGCTHNLVISKTSAPVIQLADLNGLRVGFPKRGYFDRNYGDKYIMQTINAQDPKTMTTLLIRDRLDAFAINTIVWNAYINGTPAGTHLPAQTRPFFADPVFFDEIPIYVSVSNKSRHYDTVITKLESLGADETFKAITRSIFKKYGSPDGGVCRTPTPQTLSIK